MLRVFNLLLEGDNGLCNLDLEYAIAFHSFVVKDVLAGSSDGTQKLVFALIAKCLGDAQPLG